MTMEQAWPTPKRRQVGVLDIPLALLSPGRVFARVENVASYGWIFLTLLTVVTMIGWATVQTGLIDRQVAERLAATEAELEKQHYDIVARSAFRQMLEDARKQGEFDLLMSRASHVVARPLYVLASVLGISALLYGVVALTGKKPEWHTLMTIVLLACYVDVVQLLVRFVLMWRYASLDVDDSFGVFVRLLPVAANEQAAQTATLVGNCLSGISPFAIWFWVVVSMGLSRTTQLLGWRGRLTCLLFWMAAVVAKVGIAFAPI
ncbi:MAG: hypothetical protein AABZ47_04300 [Planctomycetota bacterium]